jgi:hypothetical protein
VAKRARPVTVTNASYTPATAPVASISAGFNGIRTGSKSGGHELTLDGASCTTG